MQRREFLTHSLTALAGLSIATNSEAQDLENAAPRDWSGNTPLRYPDPDLIALEQRFQRYIPFNTPIQRHHIGTRLGGHANVNGNSIARNCTIYNAYLLSIPGPVSSDEISISVLCFSSSC